MNKKPLLKDSLKKFYDKIPNRRVHLVEPGPLTPKDITVVTVCVGYTHVFKHVVESWLPLKFHRVIVCTHYHDQKTIGFAKKYGFKCVLTPERSYIRGRYINSGIQETFNDESKWILSLDCDVFFPFKSLEIERPLYRRLYGLSHHNLNLDAFNKYKKNQRRPKSRKFKPCMGPFQLFSKKRLIEKNIHYPDNFNVSQRGKGADYHFAKKFSKKVLEDYIVCYNLGNSNGQ